MSGQGHVTFVYLIHKWSVRILHAHIGLVVPHWIDSFLLLVAPVESIPVLLDEDVGVAGAASVHGDEFPPTEDGDLHPEVCAAGQQLLLLCLLRTTVSVTSHPTQYRHPRAVGLLLIVRLGLGVIFWLISVSVHHHLISNIIVA